MKKVQALILFTVFTVVSPLWAKVNCECGSPESGITTYSVGDHQNCCTGTAAATGMFITYLPDEGNTWHVDTQTVISGTAAQNGCCPPG